MTTTLKTYPEYKDSGAEWMKKIPEEWSVVKPKIIFRERKEKSLSRDIHLTPSQKYGVLPQHKYMEITGGRVVLNLIGSDNMKHLERGDFVIHLRSFQGGIEYSSYTGKVSIAYTVLVPDPQVDQGFLKYALKSHGYISELASKTDQLRDGQSIKFYTFNLVNLPKPPIAFQKNIANYLDEKTKVIDELISKKEIMIKLLREKRSSLITQAVTKGLDPKAKMKDSNLNWVGKMPENCMVYKLRNVLKSGIVDGPHETPEYLEEGIPFISVDSVDENEKVNLDIVKKFISEEQYREYNKKTKLTENDILFTKAASIGKVAIVDKRKFMTWSPLAILKPNPDKIYYKYLFYVLKSDSFVGYVKNNCNLNTQLNIGMKILERSMIVLPETIDDQIRIGDYLDRRVNIFHRAIKLVEENIHQLKEYRSSLIYSAVTGKIKV